VLTFNEDGGARVVYLHLLALDIVAIGAGGEHFKPFHGASF